MPEATPTLTLPQFLPAGLQISDPAANLHHIFTEEDCHALWAAYAAGRPLLVRGKPGTGKSQLARAMAHQLGWAFVSETVRGGTELDDLHWRFDAIGRLGEAQALAAAGGQAGDVAARLDPLRFLTPGAFWWAFAWQSAAAQQGRAAGHAGTPPVAPSGWQAGRDGVVLLLDEIDKAEPDLPNGLLETLGSLRFNVPHIDCHAAVETPETAATPRNPIQADPARLLLVITTNEERELPQAFVRRCFVHTLRMEESAEPVLLDGKPVPARDLWLRERGWLHFADRIHPQVYLHAAALLWQDREDNPHNLYPPGLAEYLDLLRALAQLPPAEQQSRLAAISRYALHKELDHAGAD